MKLVILAVFIILVGCSAVAPLVVEPTVTYSQPDVDFDSLSDEEAEKWATSGGAE
jgi:hypothetical protein